jgi:predicted TIM-barrel fold metal-dependent hydrolase
LEPDDPYIVVSADCHAGADVHVYRTYVPDRYHEDFDAWRRGFATPWPDLQQTESREYRRNFDSMLRQKDLEADGIAAEVLYPNTVPPFAPSAGLHGRAPDVTNARDLELRWIGIHAHNEWLADFCDEIPGRRAGVAQVLLEDVDRAVEEVRWVATRGLLGGVLIPNPSPVSKLPQLHAPDYEPFWSECEALDVAVHTHGGGGGPGYEDYGPHPATPLMMFVEFGWYAFRPLVRLVMSGVLERHPDLTFVMTEVGWTPEVLQQLDYMVEQIRTASPSSVERRFAGDAVDQLSLKPSEYWQRQCLLGASLMTPTTARQRDRIGVRTMMWGADYPHSEGTHPYTRESYRHVFAGLPPEDVALILGLNAADAFGFDVAVLREVAGRIGPTAAEVAVPLSKDELRSTGGDSMAFARPAS